MGHPVGCDRPCEWIYLQRQPVKRDVPDVGIDTHVMLRIPYAAIYVRVRRPPIYDHLFTPTIGILMSLAWGVWIADRFPKLFSSFRDHSFQIFLVGIFPQMFVELFLWKRLHHEWLQIPYYLLSCVLALAFAVAVSRMASREKTPWLRWCFGLK